MIKSDKLKKERKKLKKGTLIYTLEIAVNPDSDTVEYIVEVIDEVGESLPLDSNFDYLADYWDEEDMKLLGNLYEVGES